ncbi:MAG TPA: hypothetical protein V6C46_04965, partial [Coleofasciculaceae cyanobacterium]
MTTSDQIMGVDYYQSSNRANTKKEDVMIISNLTYTELAPEANEVEGGLALANALAQAGAIGGLFATAQTFTNTNAISIGPLSAASAISAAFAF